MRRALTVEDLAALHGREAGQYRTAPRHSNAQGRRAALKAGSPSETSECRTFVGWLKLVTFMGEPLWERTAKIANERGARGAMTAILVDLGMRRGISDYFIHAPVGQWHGLYLEAKKLKEKPDVDQVAWMRKAIAWGYYADYGAGAVEMIEVTRRYFRMNGAIEAGLFVDNTRIVA